MQEGKNTVEFHQSEGKNTLIITPHIVLLTAKEPWETNTILSALVCGRKANWTACVIRRNQAAAKLQ